MSPPLIILFIPLFICIQISRRGEGRGREGGGRGEGRVHVLLTADKMSKRKIFVLVIRPASYVQWVIIKKITRLANVVIISDFLLFPLFFIYLFYGYNLLDSLSTLHKKIYSLLPATYTMTTIFRIFYL
jgi:hypothetical protein